MSDLDGLKTEADNAFRAGKLDEARVLYEQALSQKEGWVAVHNNLAMVLRLSGDLAGAEKHFRDAIDFDPQQVGARSNLGALLVEQGRPDQALETLNQAIALAPDHPGAYYNRSKVLRVTGDTIAQINDLERAVALRSEFPEALSELGLVYYEAGRLEEATVTLQRAIKTGPSLAEARINYGIVLVAKGNFHEAIASYDAALEINPSSAAAFYNKGLAFSRIPAHENAISAYNKALELDPSHRDAANNMSINLAALGRLDQAYDALERALSIDPGFEDAESNLIFRQQYDPETSAAFRFATVRAWQSHHGDRIEPVSPTTNVRNPDKVIRVGLVSPNLVRHPVGFFLLPLLNHYDQDRLVFSVFSDNLQNDEVTETMRPRVAQWQDIQGVPTQTVVQAIKEAEIDVLVDLAGHTGRNRMPVFAQRAAPIQVTWAGYVGTTGLDAMDYLLTDDRQTIAADLQYMTEQPVYLPGNYVPYQPPKDAPDIVGLPSEKSGHVTFGCFNNIDKVHDEVIATWSQILTLVPDSKLHMITFDLGDPDVQRRIRDAFHRRGIAETRLRLSGKLAAQDLLAAYNEIDIALDPFPYSGGLTTLEALWMGVPVVTRADADRFAGRHSVTHLTAAGVPELIAQDGKRYIDLAVDLAGSPDRMTGYRHSLRDRLANSPVCNGAAFVRYFERACRMMWHRWCHDEQPTAIPASDLIDPL